MVERVPIRIRQWGHRPLEAKDLPYRPYKPVIRHTTLAKRRIRTNDLLKNVIKYERIITTYHRAEVTKYWGELLIDKVKSGSWDAMKRAREVVNEGEVLEKLLLQIPIRYLRQDGDYIHIYRIPNRIRDGSRMAIVELRDHPYPSLYPALGLGHEPPPGAEKEDEDEENPDAPMKWKYVEYPDKPLPPGVPKILSSALDEPPPRGRRLPKTQYYQARQHAELVKKHFDDREDFFKQLMMSRNERDTHVEKRRREEEVALPQITRKSWDIQGIKSFPSYDDFMETLMERQLKAAEARKRQAEEAKAESS